MDELLTEMRQDLKELKAHMVDLVRQGAVHNQILETHERRSTNLEDRFKPIEQTWVFVSKLSAIVLTGGALAGSMMALAEAARFVLRK